ncbi:Deoxyribodipyrimidine photo-lyase [Rhodospirillaceae bacterium LM-1]|nr:Deoxyribodipyrimidine photo-lyase [Rhodospirillaceae bacterium LM-1]
MCGCMPSSPPRPSLFWFRRDLRLEDNAVLALAAGRGGSLALIYVLDPSQSRANASHWWLKRSLAALNADLARLRQRLFVFEGSALDVIPALAKRIDAERVLWNQVFEPEQRKQDALLEEKLRTRGVEVETGQSSHLFPPGSILNKSGQPFRVFTPFWRSCRRSMPFHAIAPAPKHLPPPLKLDGHFDLDAQREPAWANQFALHWQPGERGAKRRLDDFIDNGLADYGRRRDLPGVDGTSRLSAHLHFGEIGPFQILAAIEKKRLIAAGIEDGCEKFLSELGWREFSCQLLAQFPQLDSLEFKAEFRTHPWRADDGAVKAWQKGQTGIPIVDAGMRELWASGWMHNRVRMIAASFLVKQLQQDWRWGLAWFKDALLDADLASNAASWQWVAGCGADAAPYFRIFNPVLQGQKFDSDGSYVRRWVPEIGRLDNKLLHTPWLAVEANPSGYPLPIVNLAQARAAALAARRQ